MQTEIISSGFGGQGALFAGQLLAYAAMDAGLEVTWIPSYGPEMRGGTARCMVIIADEEIGSPLVRRPKAVMALNKPSLDKYEPLVVEGGALVANQSMIDRGLEREDLDSILIPGNKIAEEIGDNRLTNMVMMGALLELMPILSPEAIVESLKKHLPEHRKHMVPMNIEALKAGAEYVKKEKAAAG